MPTDWLPYPAQTAADVAFVQRLRGKQGPAYTVPRSSMKPSNSYSRFSLTPGNGPSLEAQITVYKGCYHLLLDEKAPNRRYKLLGVLDETVDRRVMKFTKLK